MRAINEPLNDEVDRRIVSEFAVVPVVRTKLPADCETPWPLPVWIVLKKVGSTLASTDAKVVLNKFCCAGVQIIPDDPRAAGTVEVCCDEITTGCELALFACPNDGVFVSIAARVVSVAAPDGKGKDDALTGTAGWFDARTTR
jgi:hypothetical protein